MKKIITASILLLLPICAFAQNKKESAQVLPSKQPALPPEIAREIAVKVHYDMEHTRGPRSIDEDQRLEEQLTKQYIAEYEQSKPKVKLSQIQIEKHIQPSSTQPPYIVGMDGEEFSAHCTSEENGKRIFLVIDRLYENLGTFRCSDCYASVPNKRYTYTVSFEYDDVNPTTGGKKTYDKQVYGSAQYRVTNIDTVQNIHQGKSYQLPQDDQNSISYDNSTGNISMKIRMSYSYDYENITPSSYVELTGKIDDFFTKVNAPMSIDGFKGTFHFLLNGGKNGADEVVGPARLKCTLLSMTNKAPGA